MKNLKSLTPVMAVLSMTSLVACGSETTNNNATAQPATQLPVQTSTQLSNQASATKTIVPTSGQGKIEAQASCGANHGKTAEAGCGASHGKTVEAGCGATSKMAEASCAGKTAEAGCGASTKTAEAGCGASKANK